MVRVKCSTAGDPKSRNFIRHYEVFGRRIPTDAEPSPKVFRFEIFARDRVMAKSRFWYYMNRQQKIKKTSGAEILAVREIQEKNPVVISNYAIFLRARSRSGITNLTKEYRDVTLVGAVQQMYAEMASRHRCRFYDIQIISHSRKAVEAATRPAVKTFLDSKIRFPLIHRVRKSLIQRKLVAPKCPTTFA